VLRVLLIFWRGLASVDRTTHYRLTLKLANFLAIRVNTHFRLGMVNFVLFK
jgi:hypothetical protein